MATMSRTFQGTRIGRFGLVLGLAGTIAMAIGLVVDPVRAQFSYLAAFVYVVSLAVGGLVFLMVGHAAGVCWVAPVRRLNEMVAWTVCPLAVLALPLAWGLSDLYLWADPTAHLEPHAAHLLHHKRPYLNKPAFLARSAIYFAIWVSGAWLLRRWSLRRDALAENPERTRGTSAATGQPDRVFATAWLIPVAFAVTFAGFDWLMSLQPQWLSSIFGVYYFAGGFLGSFALLTLLAARAKAGPLSDVIGPGHFHALGRMLFAFLLFWAYCAYFQLMLIRQADRPNEVVFYTERLQGGWSWFPYVLLIGHFVVPMLLLLSRKVKMWPRYMAGASAWLLIMRFVEVYWLVLPIHSPEHVSWHWLDAGALGSVIGWCLAAVAYSHHGRSVLAVGDPMLAEGIAYGGAP